MLLAAAERLGKVAGVLVDSGYNDQSFPDLVGEHLAVPVGVDKRNELHIFAVIPKFRVVERTISRLEKCLRLWKNCEISSPRFLP